MKNISIVSLVLLWLSIALVSPAQADSTAEEITATPVQMYNIVYGIVTNAYLDKTFNNQDIQIWAYKNRYEGKIKTQDDADLAIKTMIASLDDRYTRYLNTKDYQEEIDSINAKLQGIGVHIGLNDDKKVMVISPIQGSPAFEAGMMSKDIITAIDGKSTTGFSVEEVANHIKGKPDTAVKVTVSRLDEKGKSFEKTFEIKRAEIHIEAIPDKHHARLSDSICYLHLTSFISQEASKELVSRLKNLGECPSLILDLRNNPGGLLTNAIRIASIFLPEGSDIVSTVDRDGYVQTQRTIMTPYTYYDRPMVILTNGGSASASEILSGALKDNGRAVLVGETTFGKGLVQLVKELPNKSGLNITTAKYLTPNGTDIHAKGIEPNYEVKAPKETDKKLKEGPWFHDTKNFYEGKANYGDDVQLQKAVEVVTQRLLKYTS